jgi:hypothetical protein
MQRCVLAVLGWLLVSCGHDGSADTDSDSENVCADAERVHDEALRKAKESAPPCEVDSDCVVMADRASCDGSFEIEGCDMAVHHGVVDAYDERAVAQMLCDLARESEYGCSILASCAAHGDPVCREGACEFAPAKP